MEKAVNALIWIKNILETHRIPYQISGGLAAKAYGVQRELNDIDIDIPEEYFPLLASAVCPYITYGPANFRDESWDLMLITLDYEGQSIDLSGAFHSKLYNKQNSQWENCTVDFSQVRLLDIFGVQVPVISKENLIQYKKSLQRPVDLIDLQSLS